MVRWVGHFDKLGGVPLKGDTATVGGGGSTEVGVRDVWFDVVGV